MAGREATAAIKRSASGPWLGCLAASLVLAGCTAAPQGDGTGQDTASTDFTCPAASFRLDDVNVTIVTDKGDIGLVLHGAKAPITVCNFLQYVEDDFYDATIWHRICAGFVIQAGGQDVLGRTGPAHPPIHNEEPESQLRNLQGTVSMARETAPDTASTDFFLNLVDNTRLDWDGPVAPGYAVFGDVTAGWDVVQDIADTPVVPNAPRPPPQVPPTGLPLGGCDGKPVPTMETTISDVRVGP